MVQLPDSLKSRVQRLKALPGGSTPTARFDVYWKYLVANEPYLARYMSGDTTEPENMVVGQLLHVLNHALDEDTCGVLKSLGLPESQITPQEMDSFLETIREVGGFTEVDGVLCLDSPYAALDPNWSQLFLSYVTCQELPDERAAFGRTPAVLTLDSGETLRVAVFGDWGTGHYDDHGQPSPSNLVARAISDLEPDVAVHLGDVYYAGTDEQMRQHLLPGFPSGTQASFTMIGNHEMFDGAKGYFHVAMTDPRFRAQQGTSFYAIRFAKWVLLGLDTAYCDTSFLHLEGRLQDDSQRSFVASLDLDPDARIILLTHHNAVSIDGAAANNPLFSQVSEFLGGRVPDYWYFGHKHNGVVYNDRSVQGQYTCPSGRNPQLRCCGHAAIPIGKAPALADGPANAPLPFDYYAKTPVENPHKHPGLASRVQNGFLLLTLSKDSIAEEVFEVSAESGAARVWSDTHFCS